MANEEHLEILRQGVDVWNQWREGHKNVRPDLRNANLTVADLSHANLSNADLIHAKLNGADLSNANLSCAHLSSAHLGYANLTGANVSGAFLIDAILSDANVSEVDLGHANLIRADLSGANLRGAFLVNAILSDANVSEADLTHAYLYSTRFVDIDLSSAKGLDTVKHQGPSSIGTDTLKRSQCKIPESFLRGCGLSDWEIQAAKLYGPDLTEDKRTLIHYEMMRIQGEQPIMQTRVFISYSHKDTEFVEALESRLTEKGVRFWRDVHDLKAGRIESQIDRGIALNPLVLLILSEHSVKSDWVEHEAASARELERQYRDQGKPRDCLCPCALDDAWKRSDWPRVLRRQIEHYNILDFLGWREEDRLKEMFGKLYDGLILNY